MRILRLAVLLLVLLIQQGNIMYEFKVCLAIADKNGNVLMSTAKVLSVMAKSWDKAVKQAQREYPQYNAVVNV